MSAKTGTRLQEPAGLSLLTPLRATRIPTDIEASDARGVLVTALGSLGAAKLPLVTSLAPEGIVILHLLTRLVHRPRVITIDTGRLPDETHDLIDRVRDRFGIDIDVITPDNADVAPMVRERGANLFYRSVDDRLRCCEVRKVLPLRRALAGSDGWITGLRREQASTRRVTPKIARDIANGMIWKVAPLADWTSDRVWSYVRAHDLPYNALHDDGYESIGCAPCTRAVAPDEDERAGRWWWEEAGGARECGLHVAPASAEADDPAAGLTDDPGGETTEAAGRTA
jgi:phosphoadenosine phosphosulfate reductase